MEGARVVVMCNVYNAAETVEDFLRSLTEQTWKEFEILLVDDGSTDGTLSLAKRFEDRLHLRYLRLAHLGLRGARAAGMKAAEADFVIVLDADEVVSPCCVERFIRGFDDPSVGAVGGRLAPLGEGWIREGTAVVRRLKEKLRRGWDGEVLAVMGGCSAYRMTAVHQIGGFNPAPHVAEDYDVSSRLRAAGWRLRNDSAIEVLHRDPVTLAGIFRRQFRVGRRVLPTLGTRRMSASVIVRLFLPLQALALLVLAGATLDPWLLVALLGSLTLAALALLWRFGASMKQRFSALPVLATDVAGYSAGLLAGAVATLLGRR